MAQLNPALAINANWSDLMKETERICQLIDHWGEVYGAAQAEVVMAEHEFAHWKATVFKAEKESAAKPPSDAACRMSYRAEGAYVQFAQRLAQAEGNLKKAMGAYNAFKAKAELLNTLIRTIGSPPGMATEAGGSVTRKPVKKPV